MNIIRIELRNVFGEHKAYPVCSAARTFAAIAGTKTLTRATLRGVLALGYSIAVAGTEQRVYHPGMSPEAGALINVR